MNKKTLLSLVVIAIFLAVFVWFWRSGTFSNSEGKRRGSVNSSLINQTALEKLEKRDASKIDFSHLGPSVTAPTTKWFSGFALQAEPQPGFAYPNSYLPSESGLGIGLPEVKETPNTVFGSHSPTATVNIKDAKKYVISRYDDLSVDIRYFDSDGAEVGTATVTQGSPYALFRLKSGKELTISGDASKYGQLKSGDDTVVYTVPRDTDKEEIAKYAENPVTGGTATYKIENGKVITTLSYETKGGQPTLLALLPHQSERIGQSKVKYDSILGEMKTVVGQEISYETQAVENDLSVNVSNLPNKEKEMLAAQLKKDMAANKLDTADTYFGGKQLFRAATLLEIAVQLKEDAIAEDLTQQLQLAFDDWSDPASARGFYYDEKLKTLVGKQASFGADQANDHHFHYGYFIHAASILARHDQKFEYKHGQFIDLLTADIANYRDGEALPLRRNFDPYNGHSWASGSAPFRDGNNQESSSEAINAWAGTLKWAEIREDSSLADTSTWMLANEADTTRRYWMDAKSGDYNHQSVGIIWGGKKDWGTWFSAEPNAIVAIQLLPMTPSLAAVYENHSDVLASALSAPSLRTDTKFGDYILMARSLTENVALSEAESLPDESIDDGNSRTWLYAWILTNRK